MSKSHIFITLLQVLVEKSPRKDYVDLHIKMFLSKREVLNKSRCQGTVMFKHVANSTTGRDVQPNYNVYLIEM